MHDESRERADPAPARDDGDLARLLSAVGPRGRPSDTVEREVRAAVEAEWRRAVTERRRRSRLPTWLAAAGIAVAAIALWIARPTYLSDQAQIASVARAIGAVEQYSGGGRWTPLAEAAAIPAGVEIRSSADGRAALRLGDGIELRLDSRSRIALDDAHHATLSQGAVYVDSGAGGRGSADFLLETPLGTVRHLGTQYEARLAAGGLKVGIREGRVQVRGTAGDITGHAGELLTIQDHSAARSRLSRSASDWDWIAAVTPPFSIEGRTVEAFLDWAGRETGREVVYASREVERQASHITLSGTIEELTPSEAIDAVLSTTSLKPVFGDNQIRIDSAAR